MSYRKRIVRVLTERCFKQKALKYVDTSIKLSAYCQLCFSVVFDFAASTANTPVSFRFLREFDIARRFEKPLSPSSTLPIENLRNPTNNWVRSA